MATLSARQFNQDVSAAKRYADEAPVIITDRGKPAYVLMTIGDYEAISSSSIEGFLDRLVTDVDVDFEPAHISTDRVEF